MSGAARRGAARRGVAWRGVAWRGVAWRSADAGAAAAVGLLTATVVAHVLPQSTLAHRRQLAGLLEQPGHARTREDGGAASWPSRAVVLWAQ